MAAVNHVRTTGTVTAVMVALVAAVPDRSFDDGPQDAGSAVESCRRQIDDAPKDPHEAGMGSSNVRVRMIGAVMLAHRHSPVWTLPCPLASAALFEEISKWMRGRP